MGNTSPLIPISSFGYMILPEAEQLIDMIQSNVINRQVSFDLSTLDFIQSIDCSLKFQIDDTDYGIEIPSFGNDFICRLTVGAFKEMVGYLEVFANETNSVGGYNWLYDAPENKTDLLLSPGETGDRCFAP